MEVIAYRLLGIHRRPGAAAPGHPAVAQEPGPAGVGILRPGIYLEDRRGPGVRAGATPDPSTRNPSLGSSTVRICKLGNQEEFRMLLSSLNRNRWDTEIRCPNLHRDTAPVLNSRTFPLIKLLKTQSGFGTAFTACPGGRTGARRAARRGPLVPQS